MAARVLPDHNYGYVCDTCELCIQLFALLPHYSDLRGDAEDHALNTTAEPVVAAKGRLDLCSVCREFFRSNSLDVGIFVCAKCGADTSPKKPDWDRVVRALKPHLGPPESW